MGISSEECNLNRKRNIRLVQLNMINLILKLCTNLIIRIAMNLRGFIFVECFNLWIDMQQNRRMMLKKKKKKDPSDDMNRVLFMA